MIRRLKLALLVLAAAILLPSAALAATVTGPSQALTVSATVVAKCTITSGTISFGNLDLTANPTSASAARPARGKCLRQNGYSLVIISLSFCKGCL